MVLGCRNIETTSMINSVLTPGEGLMKQHLSAVKFQVFIGAPQPLGDRLSCLSTTKALWGYPLITLITLI